jgi:GT2 family glycosyltransferase
VSGAELPSTVPISVLIPTIGRVEQLLSCLASLRACRPRPAELLVVDQSGGADVAAAVAACEELGAATVACEGLGIALATNVGLRAATSSNVLVTHDDCTVAPSWVGVGHELMVANPGAIVTGRVLPAGDSLAVPSTIDEPEPHDYTGELSVGALFANNMGLPRERVIELGGFDERFPNASEDNDVCWRWLRAGRRLLYEPELAVWHHDWRSEEELERLYVRYAYSQGMFYAKQLCAGDLKVLPFLTRDLYEGLRSSAGGLLLRDRPRWADRRRGIVRGMPRGLVRGWRLFRRRAPG